MPSETNAHFTGKPGKLLPKIDPRTLDFSKYIDLKKINAPAQVDWTLKKTTPWGMMNNWLLSDCTCAAAGHMIECWTANTSTEHTITNKSVMKVFTALSGYDPVTGKNDTPLFLKDVLKYWRKNGIGEHKIKAYAIVNHKDRALVKACTYIFGGVYAGIFLPMSVKGEDIWEVADPSLAGTSAPGSFGGHTVNLVAYDDNYLTCISWGKVQKMTWGFWETYGDELYAIITKDFFDGGKSPSGLDLAALETDLLSIARAKDTAEKQLLNARNIKEGKKEKPSGRSGQTGGSAGSKGG